MTRFRAEWPIRDDRATLAQLQDEALDDYAELAHRAHVVIVGDIEWDIDENDEGDLTLTATAPVNPVTFGAYYYRKATASAR